MILDSNIIIYSVKPEYIRLARYLQTNQNIVRVSLISTLEVLGFNRLTQTDKLTFEAYFASVDILPISREVIMEAIRLRQQNKRSLGDSIIAATALIHNLPLLTNNTIDFQDISNLEIIPLTSIL
jgi:predicted nucleic acid-binding protein